MTEEDRSNFEKNPEEISLLRGIRRKTSLLHQAVPKNKNRKMKIERKRKRKRKRMPMTICECECGEERREKEEKQSGMHASVLLFFMLVHCTTVSRGRSRSRREAKHVSCFSSRRANSRANSAAPLSVVSRLCTYAILLHS